MRTSKLPTVKLRVLEALIRRQSLTPSEALRECNSWRLAAVICELRKKHGLAIITHNEHNSNGTSHARYELTDADGAIKLLQQLNHPPELEHHAVG